MTYSSPVDSRIKALALNTRIYPVKEGFLEETGWRGFGLSKVKGKVKSLSRVGLFATPWTVAYQTPPSMGFSRQRYWSGLPFPSPEDLPDPGIEPRSTFIAGRRFTL